MKRKRKPLELEEENDRQRTLLMQNCDRATGLMSSNTNKKNNAKLSSFNENSSGVS